MKMSIELLRQHAWKLVEMGPVGALRPISPEFKITLQFEDNARISGASACNRYFAACRLDASQLRIQYIGATRMMCSEPAMALENAYFAALGQVETYQLQEERLTLYCDHGKTVLLFTA
jgi:heat shock protein HslJ